MTRPFRIAAITTAYYKNSHADVIVSRWLEPRSTDPEWGWPLYPDNSQTTIASLFIAPTTHHAADDPHREIGREIAERHGVPIFNSITKALTLGTDALAVDGILFIGEHGDFPLNERGQKLYPRYEYWKQMVEVMRATGRTIPIFLDKHLSYDNARAREMVTVSEELGIPLMAGSSLPHCKMSPALIAEPGAERDEVLTLFYGGTEVYGFHILDLAQSLIENRLGAESGIRRVRTFTGAEVWQAVDSGLCSPDLLQAALGAAKYVTPGDPRENSAAAPPRNGISMPVAFQIEHEDSLRATHLLLQGHLQDFVVAIQDKQGRIQAARNDSGDGTNFYAHFAVLNRNIERFFLHGEISAPIERTLLTTLTINTLMEAVQNPGQWLETSHLKLAYNPTHCIRPEWPQRKQG